MTLLFVFFSVFLVVEPSHSKTLLSFSSEGLDLQVEEVFSGLGVPWGIDFIDSNTMIISERKGRLSTLNLTSKVNRPIELPFQVFERGQGGLLDVAVYPDRSQGVELYFSYSARSGKGYTTYISKAGLKGAQLINHKLLFKAEPARRATRHFGSRIVFLDGYVYFSVGDRGERKAAQSLSAHSGKILRIKPNGEVPLDNPFVGQKNARSEIWSYGHRNPQGLAVHPQTGLLWEQEHGPRGGDEINIIKKGANYGWPVITYGKEYWGPSIGEGEKKEGMEQPIKYFVPSIAPSGLEIYSSNVIKSWKGNVFSGALKLKHLNRLVIKDKKVVKEERLLKSLKQRIREVTQGPDGFLYLSTDSGQILRIRPAVKK